MASAAERASPSCVLVVDEDGRSRDAAVRALRAQGFDTREATSGQLAEAAVERFRPDLVLLETALSDGSGMELARRLSHGHGTPIVFLAAERAVEERIAGLEVADDYVTKPFSGVELAARVRAVLRRRTGDADRSSTGSGPR